MQILRSPSISVVIGRNGVSVVICFKRGADGEEKIISYFSRSTTKDERKWDTRELEVLAMIATLEYFRH